MKQAPAASNVNWSSRTALITGASSGIGAAAALRLAAAGMPIILVARRADALVALAERIRQHGGQAVVEPADLSREEDCQRVASRHPNVYALINSAGLGWYGYFSRMPWGDAQAILRVNVEAAVRLSWAYLPSMQSRGEGHIINIGSVIGGFPMQGTAMYAGSKAFLDAFTTALHRELRGSGVCASVLRPGPVDTSFFELASARAGSQALPGHSFAVPARRIAEAIWSLLRRPRRVAYVPAILGFMPWLEMTSGWLIDRVGPLLLRQGGSPLPEGEIKR